MRSALLTSSSSEKGKFWCWCKLASSDLIWCISLIPSFLAPRQGDLDKLHQKNTKQRQNVSVSVSVSDKIWGLARSLFVELDKSCRKEMFIYSFKLAQPCCLIWLLLGRMWEWWRWCSTRDRGTHQKVRRHQKNPPDTGAVKWLTICPKE